MDSIELVIDDLARQVAQKALEAAQWKAHAISAEAALAQLKEDAEEDEDE